MSYVHGATEALTFLGLNKIASAEGFAENKHGIGGALGGAALGAGAGYLLNRLRSDKDDPSGGGTSALLGALVGGGLGGGLGVALGRRGQHAATPPPQATPPSIDPARLQFVKDKMSRRLDESRAYRLKLEAMKRGYSLSDAEIARAANAAPSESAYRSVTPLFLHSDDWLWMDDDLVRHARQAATELGIPVKPWTAPGKRVTNPARHASADIDDLARQWAVEYLDKNRPAGT